ncbi:MAG: hypothetical protein U0872_02640 [Planctomycetaceae bacterium]
MKRAHVIESPSPSSDSSPAGASCEACEKPAVLCLMDTHSGAAFVFRCFCEEHGQVYLAVGPQAQTRH